MSTGVAGSPERVGVLIIEDQTAIRHLLAAYVGAMPGFAIVGEAGNVAEALEIAAATRPQVVVLDWMLPGEVGLNFLQLVRIDPPPRILVFSANTTELAMREAFAAGASGYIEKTASFAEFTAALMAVAAGQTVLSPLVAAAMKRGALDPRRVGSGTELSERERVVLQLLAEGLSSKQIAARLGLSGRTVENHRASIMKRTGLRSIPALVLHAVRLGLVDASLPSNP